MNRLKRSLNDDEDDEVMGQEVLGYTTQTESRTLFTFTFDEPISNPLKYREFHKVCINASQYDEIQLLMNTPGGQLSGLSTVLDGLARTRAKTVAVIQGECHSAGSIIVLHCDDVVVGPYAQSLCHNVGYGVGFGKDADVVAHTSFISDFSKDLMIETYRGFLNEGELKDMLNGKQIWMKAPEIIQRLKKRVAFLKAEASKPVPTKKPPRKKAAPQE